MKSSIIALLIFLGSSAAMANSLGNYVTCNGQAGSTLNFIYGTNQIQYAPQGIGSAFTVLACEDDGVSWFCVENSTGDQTSILKAKIATQKDGKIAAAIVQTSPSGSILSDVMSCYPGD